MCEHICVWVEWPLLLPASLPPPHPPSQLREAVHCYASLALWLLALIPYLCLLSHFPPFNFFLTSLSFRPTLFTCSSVLLLPSLPHICVRACHLASFISALRELVLTVYSQKGLSCLVVSRLSHPLALLTLCECVLPVLVRVCIRECVLVCVCVFK